MNNDILNQTGKERILSFFDGKKLFGCTNIGAKIYIDRQCTYRYTYAPNWGKGLTPKEFDKPLIVVPNNLQASLVLKNNVNCWHGDELEITKKGEGG